MPRWKRRPPEPAAPFPAKYHLPALIALSFAVFWPCLNNGFISDDFIFLDRVDAWVENPLYLFGIPPENFRSTTYLAFLVLKTLFGYQAAMFYGFTILLHAVNGFLLGRLIGKLTSDPVTGDLAAVLFVACQNPQEAVMWLGGMHENLQGFFLLGLLHLWASGRLAAAAGLYCLALLSKESAPVAIPLALLLDGWRGCRPAFLKYLLYLGLPTMIFGLLFLHLAQSNSLLVGGFYTFDFRAGLVLLNSLHRLAFPWLYLAAGLTFWMHRRLDLTGLRWTVAWMVLGLLPYVFLTYQDHVPSRHEYLASMGASAFISICLKQISLRKAATLFLVVYLLGNAGYIALRKDAQFEERAAPTTQLIEEMQSRAPRALLVAGFPLNPWIARMTTRLVPGWEPSLIRIAPEECVNCLQLHWDQEQKRYMEEGNR